MKWTVSALHGNVPAVGPRDELGRIGPRKTWGCQLDRGYG